MRRLLIVRLSALGDIVHGLPVLASLRAAHPDAEIDWLVDQRYRAVLDLVDGVSRQQVWQFPRLAGSGGVAELIGRLRASRYDAAIDLQGLLKSAVLARLSGARRVIGFDRRELREPRAAACYTERVSPGAYAHVIEKNLALARAAGATSTEFVFPVRAGETPALAEARARLGVREGQPYILLNPGAGWPNKQWSPARFGKVAAALRARHGWPSCVLWGPSERELADRVVVASAGAACEAPPTQLADVVALAQGAAAMVSGDTGPTQLACAVGTPIVALFGPTDPVRNGPWGARSVVLSRHDHCECRWARRCHRPRPCLDEIAVADVVAGVERVVEG